MLRDSVFIVPVLLIALSGCSPGKTPESRASGVPTASSPAVATSTNEEQAIEDAIEAYLTAVDEDDIEARKRYSTGELNIIADWQAISVEAAGEADSTMTINDVRVVNVTATDASASVDATLEYGNPEFTPTDFSGTWALKKINGSWRVHDHPRNGANSRIALAFTETSARQTKYSITVRVVGADLSDQRLSLILRVENKRPSGVSFLDARAVLPSGRQLGDGNMPIDEVAGKAHIDTLIVWDQEVALSTRSVRLILQAYDEDGIGFDDEFDFSVKFAG